MSKTIIDDNSSTSSSDDSDKEDPFKSGVPLLEQYSSRGAPLYKVNDDGKKIPVRYETHYQHRGVELECLGRLEYFSIIRIKRKVKKKKGKKGREANKCYDFDDQHPLHETYVQVLVSKQSVPILTGNPPPSFPGEYETATDKNAWKKSADLFAKFFLVAFKPGVGCEKDKTPLTWKGLTSWVKELTKRDTWIDRLRLKALFAYAHGIDTPAGTHVLLNLYRGRNRTLWTDEEKEEAERLFASNKTVSDEFQSINEHIIEGKYREFTSS